MALLAVQFTAAAQTGIRVIIKSNVKIDSLSVIDISQKEFHSFPFKDTINFKFNKQTIDCYNVRCSVKGKTHWKQLWLNANNVTIKAHFTDALQLVIDTVLNSPVYYNVIDYLKTSLKLPKNDTVARNNFMLGEIQKNIENPRSIAIANDYVNYNQNSKPNLLKLKLLLSKQQTDFSWFLFYNIGIDRMNNILAIKNIRLADFKFADKKNKIVTIGLHNYDYYLLDFWFVGCAPCMKQHKEIKLNQQKLKDKRIRVIGICIDKKAGPWNKYLVRNGYNWANYLESGTHTLSGYLAINAFPAYMILNSRGDILYTFGSLNNVFTVLKINHN